MPTYDTDTRHLGALIVEHERQRRAAVGGAVSVSVRNAAKIVRAAAPKASGALRDSVEIEGNEVVVNAPHAVAVEVGQRPHVAPLAPLIKWAETIGADRDLAVATWKKIAREGVAPTWFVRSSIPRIVEVTGASVRYALRK